MTDRYRVIGFSGAVLLTYTPRNNMPTKNSPTKNLVFAAISFAIAVVCWSGLVLANDPVGRIIFGSVWTLLGIGWLGRYFMQRKAGASEASGAPESEVPHS